MGHRAVEYAQDYAWEKIADQIVDVYQELVGGIKKSAGQETLHHQ